MTTLLARLRDRIPSKIEVVEAIFSAIGIELDAEYVAIARRRIASDIPLFAEASS